MKKFYFLSTLLLACTVIFGVTAAVQKSMTPASRPVLHRTSAAATPPGENAGERTQLVTPSLGMNSRGAGMHVTPLRFGLHDGSIAAKAPAKVLGDGTTIYGGLIYSTTWSGTGGDYGLYTFPAADYTLPKKVATTYEANGGGCYGEGKYYFNSYVYTEEMGYTFITFCVMDMATGEVSKTIHSFIEDGFNQSLITNGMAFDPTTGRMYALSYIAVELVEGALQKYYPAIAEIDPYNGLTSPIARIPEMAALAINQSGEMYAISMGADASLYRINKESGDCTLIGSTGQNARFVQSATFDPVTGKLYWAAVHNNGSTGLYEVNTSTGKADLITSFANHEEYGSLFIPAPEIADKAPALATDLTASFVQDSHTGTISFKMPALAHDGSKLSGDLTAILTVDGTEVLNRKAASAETVSHEITLTEGVHGFVACISNEAGESARVGGSVYVGLDAPAAVQNLKATADADHNAVITWDAPEKGRNDGYIDPAQITYTVTRLPDNTAVASGLRTTSFTDRSMSGSGNYSYTVTPWIGTREGLPATSDEALFGQGGGLPCRFSFDTPEDYALFTVIDANEDWEAQYHWGGWMYSPTFSYAKTETPCAVYGFSPENAADDWLVTPPFKAQKAKKYRVTFSTKVSSDPETLTVTAGADNTVAAQTITVLPQAQYSDKDYTSYSGEFVAGRDGNCFVGFHVTSKKKAGYLYIDDILVEEVPDNDGPQSVGSLSASAGAAGAMTAEVSFTAPDKCVDGSALTSISKIEIFRGNDTSAAGSIANPQPGSRQSWTDTDPEQGWNEYRVVAYNAAGTPGEAARTTVYVGVDTPLAPTDLILTEENGYPVLRWTAPSGGANGGYIDADAMKYVVYRFNGETTDIIARNASGTEFTDTGIDGSEKQYFLIYQLVPFTTAGMGEYAVSNSLVYGDPYEGDFFESFSDQYTQNDPWTLEVVKGRQQLWGLYSQGTSPVCAPVDGDYGLATFAASAGSINDESRLISPKLALKAMKNPILSFYFYHNVSYDTAHGEEPFKDRLVVEALTPEGVYKPLCEPVYVDDPTVEPGWYEYTLPLSALKEFDWIRLSMHGYSDVEQDVNIDAVSVKDIADYDLAVQSFTGPARVKADRSASFSLTLFNNGFNEASGYDVVLKRDNKEIDRIKSSVSLAPEHYASYDFTVPMSLDDEGKSFNFSACIEWDKDENPTNNASETLTTVVTAPALPEVYKLHATLKGDADVELSWNRADALHVNDDFEDYTAFANNNIGDFTLYDGDKGNTYGFSDIYFQHSGEPGSYLVFNPDILGITKYLPEWCAYSGSQCLAAFSAYDPSTQKSVANDDWLISPEVHGGQTVSFYVKTANYEWGYETFRIYYSTTSQDPGTMVSMWEEAEAPKDWTKVTVTLPVDAKYFAIVCTSIDKFVFYIDDVNFVAKADASAYDLTGYRVYRDGAAIADVTADTYRYTDSAVAPGEHNYTVRALYGNRESGDSDRATMTVGMGSVSSLEAAGISITGGKGEILVTGLTEENDHASDNVRMRVAAASGLVVYDGIPQTVKNLEPGIYMVCIGTHHAVKVTVR